jgi:hypothetical protein
MQEGIKEQAANPDTNGTVGHIKGGPVIRLPEDVQEIDHLPQPEAIDAIAYGPPNNQANARQGQDLLPRGMFEIQQQDNDGKECHRREKQPQECGVVP